MFLRKSAYWPMFAPMSSTQAISRFSNKSCRCRDRLSGVCLEYGTISYPKRLKRLTAAFLIIDMSTRCEVLRCSYEPGFPRYRLATGELAPFRHGRQDCNGRNADARALRLRSTAFSGFRPRLRGVRVGSRSISSMPGTSDAWIHAPKVALL
jgi:hypothetical protein